MNERKIHFSIDRTTGVPPPYLQIVEQATEALHIGNIVLGVHLHSVSEVVQVADINANTAMKEYRELEYAGISKLKPREQAWHR